MSYPKENTLFTNADDVAKYKTLKEKRKEKGYRYSEKEVNLLGYPFRFQPLNANTHSNCPTTNTGLGLSQANTTGIRENSIKMLLQDCTGRIGQLNWFSRGGMSAIKILRPS